MPDSRHKYLYERLGDHDFQQLVGALLTLRFTEFLPFPLRQADGGRDGVDPSKRLIYQVKWSQTGSERDAVKWLDAEIRREAPKIKRFASEGIRKYVLVTNVPSTGPRLTGTFDKLNEKLDAYSKEFGLEMSCIWREALNPMVDSAPSETKWAYADMLAGWDLIRYLLSEQAVTPKDSGLGDLVRKVVAVQWDEDERIKFSQVELDREHLSDLFVDVPAQRLRVPRRSGQLPSGPNQLGGTAAYIAARGPYPFTLVRGAPGQGKSTLSQFVCQAFRIAFIAGQDAKASGLPDVKEVRFPIRCDLGDYAAWMQGFDVFDKSENAKLKKGKRRPAAQSTIEFFLADLMTHASGRDSVTPTDVQDLFDRVPSLIVLDGLDEVGKVSDRQRVVREIDLFCARGRTYAVEPKVIVTTRPNSAGLAEPNPDIFEVIALSPLDAALRDTYLRKWCIVHNVRGSESRTLRRNFTEKTREPYIGELASNPMQLTILLFLLRQHGDATPSQRTELYDSYMSLLLSREANKHPESVRKYRNDLMEIVPFLGWYIQSRAEEGGHSGRMADEEVRASMKHFQRTYGKPESVVDELFEAATDRLWALTSKEEGTYEFEVLSLREYFAARFLYRFAGEGDPDFDRTSLFRELLRRPFWLNTVRFYGGNAAGSDIYVLEAGIRHELKANASKHVRVAAWTLLTDGVFNSRPMEAMSLVNALTDDAGIRHLLAALDGKEITPLPESSHADSAWQRLTTEIAADPAAPANSARVRVLRELLGLKREFLLWWVEQLRRAIGTSDETDWLSIGAECEAAAGVDIGSVALSAEDGINAQLILNAGIVPGAGSALEGQLLRAVLDGQCSETTSVRSEPAQIAAALSPAEFFIFGSNQPLEVPVASSPDRRALAIQHLRKEHSPYAHIATLRRFKRGEKDTTFPWANVSTALLEHVGRSWLVSEIAVIGAASPLRNGFTRMPGTEGLGSGSHPAALIAETRKNRSDTSWWRGRLDACGDDLALAEWGLALWAVADGFVIDELSATLAATMERISPRLQRSVRVASHRIQAAGFLDSRIISESEPAERLTRLLASRKSGSPSLSAESPVIPLKMASKREELPVKSMADEARRAKWFKVDKVPTYR